MGQESYLDKANDLEAGIVQELLLQKFCHRTSIAHQQTFTDTFFDSGNFECTTQFSLTGTWQLAFSRTIQSFGERTIVKNVFNIY